MSVLEVKGVGYYYFSDKPVLRDICLSFEKGKFMQSAGHRAAGKRHFCL